jgi:uncharacterized membrane protein
MKNLIVYLIIILNSTATLRANSSLVLAELVRKEIVNPRKNITSINKKEKRKKARLEKRQSRYKKKHKKKKCTTKVKVGEPRGDGRDYSMTSNIFLDIGLVSLLIMFAIPVGSYLLESLLPLMVISSMIPGLLFIIAMLTALICLIIGFIKLKRSRETPKGMDKGLVFGIGSVLLAVSLTFLFLTPFPYFIGAILSCILLGILCLSIVGIFYNKRQIQKRPSKKARIGTTIND